MIALAIAALLMIAVIVVIVLQSRRIARLERRLAERGEGADEVALRRVAELQAREEISTGGLRGTDLVRPALMVGAGVLVVVLVVAGVWMFVTGGDGGVSNGNASAGRTTAQQPKGPVSDPIAATTIPANVPPLADTSRYSVAVFNASGVAGAAGDVVTPRLETEGYQVPITRDYPNGVSDLKQSVVMYNGDQNRNAAWNIAQVLGIPRAPKLEGLTVEQIGGADVVVVIGLDIANKLVNGGAVQTTP